MSSPTVLEIERILREAEEILHAHPLAPERERLVQEVQDLKILLTRLREETPATVSLLRSSREAIDDTWALLRRIRMGTATVPRRRPSDYGDVRNTLAEWRAAERAMATEAELDPHSPDAVKARHRLFRARQAYEAAVEHLPAIDWDGRELPDA